MKPRREEALDLERARKRIQDYCARRERCSADVLRRLNAWGLEEEKVEQLISELQGDRFIDDTRYAVAFVRDHIRFNHWGERRIEQALFQQGISRETIREALLQAKNDGLSVDLVRLLAQRSVTLQKELPQQRRQKLLRYAISRGFAYNEACEALVALARQEDEQDQ